MRATCSWRPTATRRAATATSRSRWIRATPYDTLATYTEAMRLHAAIDRPNLMVKVPATTPGLAAFEDLIAMGRSVNVTLIFSLPPPRRHRRGVPARPRAARRRRRGPLEGRVRRELLHLADRHRGRPPAHRARRPGSACAAARDREREARLRPLHAHASRARAGMRSHAPERPRSGCCGRRRQPRTRPTGTMYVEELIGADTVNTMTDGDDPRLPGPRPPAAGAPGRRAEARRVMGPARRRGRRLRGGDRHARARGGRAASPTPSTRPSAACREPRRGRWPRS